MRSWHIIAASTLAATTAGVLLVVLGGLPWRSGIAALVIPHWPVIALVWLSTYGLVVPVLTTLAALLEGGVVTRRRAWDDDRVRRYLVQLAATQFYTAVLGLLALGLSRVPVETTLFPALPSPIGDSPAFAACGAIAVIGLLGGLLTAAAVTSESPETESAVPGVRASRLFGEVSE